VKQYPSIPGPKDTTVPYGENCVGYYKYDGSNLRCEWNKKKGWYKFGTRHRLFDHRDEQFNQAIPIFLEKVGPIVEQIVRLEVKGITDFIVYTEYLGPNSFAGSHLSDDPKQLILLDVHIPKKGFIVPKRFNKIFEGQEFTPEVVYEGKFTAELVADVRAGRYPLNEGMMCKGSDHRGTVWMTKIKTQAYLDKLKGNFGDDWEKYSE